MEEKFTVIGAMEKASEDLISNLKKQGLHVEDIVVVIDYKGVAVVKHGSDLVIR